LANGVVLAPRFVYEETGAKQMARERAARCGIFREDERG